MGYFDDYPKCVFCILGNEFCERFSYYGMRAILVLFLNRALMYDEDTSTIIYHSFVMLCYFMPIVGAIIADGWLGKYKTILYVSMIYGLGNICMALSAIPYNGSYVRWAAIVAMVLIAFGTGGIKPCVVSFGGDQFADHQVKQKESFFSLFYIAINVGSLMSMIVTPVLRSNVYCFDDNCWSVAFGVPAILMIVAIIVFWIGRRWYKINPPGNNVIGMMFHAIWLGIKGKCSGCCSKTDNEKKDHWLDYAEVKFEKSFVQDVKDVMSVAWLFLPIPVFWALFEQQGSRWVMQAGQMDGYFPGGFVLQPDLIQVVNPLFIVTILPLMDAVIYPCLDKLHIPNRPLQRMGFGMFLAGFAFVLAAFLQIAIDNRLPPPIQADMSKFKVINTLPCGAVGLGANNENVTSSTVEYEQDTDYFDVEAGTIDLTFDSVGCGYNPSTARTFTFEEKKAYILFVVEKSGALNIESLVQEKTDRTERGKSTVWYVNTLEKIISISAIANDGEESTPHVYNDIAPFNHSIHEELLAANFDVSLTKLGTKNDTSLIGTIASINGAVYTVVIQNDSSGNIVPVQHTDVSANDVNILWQLPQYFVITLAEVFFSVSGLSFAYSQAPTTMKAVVQALWLLTSAFGQVIVILIAEVGGNMSQKGEFFLFAGLMFVTDIVFIIMAITYKYVKPPAQEELEKQGNDLSLDIANNEDKKGADNLGYEKELANGSPPKYTAKSSEDTDVKDNTHRESTSL